MRDPLNLSLAGLPELELFPGDEARDEAFRRLSANPDRPRAWVVPIMVAVVVLLGFSLALHLLLNGVLKLPLAASIPIHVVVQLSVVLVVIRVLHRRIMRHELRVQLLDADVPVCLGCGYGLHGLDPDAPRCPECGRAIDERAQSLLAGASSRSRGRDR